jgi:hypothetical protein
VNANPKKDDVTRASHTVDAVPEDEQRQDELNRRLRKPGEPGHCPPEKKSAPVESQTDTHVNQK